MRCSNKAFTLVELLLVIGLIGIISAGLLATLDPFTQVKKGKDGQRKSDIATIQRALETFHNDKNSYACFNICGSWGIASSLGAKLVPTYIRSIPDDPASSKRCPGYVYSVSSDGRQYTIFAKLEHAKDPDALRAKVTPSAPPTGETPDDYVTFNITAGTCAGTSYNYWVNNP